MRSEFQSENLEGRNQLGRPRRGWQDNIKVDIKELGWKAVDWIKRGSG
jgi:hypothetical protein